MATFTPGAYGIRTDYNFVSSMALHKPDIDPELTLRYGNQYLNELWTYFGKTKGTSSLEYIHYEEDRFYPKIQATNGGAGSAGAAVTFTLSGSSLTVPQNASPYVGTPVNVTAIPVRVGDVIGIKPATGTVTSTSIVQAQVTSVNAGAGTFSATPVVTGTAIPNVASASEIIILYSAFGEGSNQPDPMNSKVTAYTNNLMNIRETHRVTGTEADIVTWVEFKGPNGEKKYGYKVKGEADAYKRLMIKKENALLVGQKLTNVTLADVQATAGTPTTITEGLMTAIDNRGNPYNYSGLSSLTLGDFESIVKTLQTQVGAKVNMLPCGINLSLAIDQILGDRFVNGAISYGNFTGEEKKFVDLSFDSFKIGNFTFHKKTLESFSDLQTFGAAGYGYINEGLVIPMENFKDANSGEPVPAIRTRYLVAPDGSGNRLETSTVFDGFKQGDSGQDYMEVRMLTTVGLELFAANRFVHILQA